MSAANGNWRTVRRADGEILLRARWCTGFWCKFKGLMLRAGLSPEEGLVFVYRRESVMETSIHMLFMRFAIAAIWLDSAGTVVDKALARPWRLAYVPQKPAQYVLEAPVALLERVAIGERLVFEEPERG